MPAQVRHSKIASKLSKKLKRVKMEVCRMKRLSVRWIVGYDENNEPIFRRQSILVDDNFDVANAQAVVDMLDKYSKYACRDAQLVTTESVGDML